MQRWVCGGNLALCQITLDPCQNSLLRNSQSIMKYHWRPDHILNTIKLSVWSAEFKRSTPLTQCLILPRTKTRFIIDKVSTMQQCTNDSVISALSTVNRNTTSLGPIILLVSQKSFIIKSIHQNIRHPVTKSMQTFRKIQREISCHHVTDTAPDQQFSYCKKVP